MSDQACRSNRNSCRSISEVEGVEGAEEEKDESRSRIPIAAMRPNKENCFAGGGKTPGNHGGSFEIQGVRGQGVQIPGMISTLGLTFRVKKTK